MTLDAAWAGIIGAGVGAGLTLLGTIVNGLFAAKKHKREIEAARQERREEFLIEHGIASVNEREREAILRLYTLFARPRVQHIGEGLDNETAVWSFTAEEVENISGNLAYIPRHLADEVLTLLKETRWNRISSSELDSLRRMILDILSQRLHRKVTSVESLRRELEGLDSKLVDDRPWVWPPPPFKPSQDVPEASDNEPMELGDRVE